MVQAGFPNQLLPWVLQPHFCPTPSCRRRVEHLHNDHLESFTHPLCIFLVVGILGPEKTCMLVQGLGSWSVDSLLLACTIMHFSDRPGTLSSFFQLRASMSESPWLSGVRVWPDYLVYTITCKNQINSWFRFPDIYYHLHFPEFVILITNSA